MSDKKILYPYIKPTNYLYGGKRGGFWGKNGFYNMEVGYMTMKDNKPDEIIVLSKCSDSVIIDLSYGAQNTLMDCVKGGYIRLFSEEELKWGDERPLHFSTMRLIKGEPMIEEQNV